MTNSGWNKIMSDSTQTIGVSITCLVTFCATNSRSVTWSRYFQSVIQVSAQELGTKQNVTKHATNCFSLILDHLSCVCELIWASFHSWVIVTWAVVLGNTIYSQKNQYYACAGIKLSLSVRVSRWTQAFACRVWNGMTHCHWVSAMNIKLPRVCSLFSLVNISGCAWQTLPSGNNWRLHSTSRSRKVLYCKLL